MISYTFLKQAFSSPKTVGAIIPSSKYLAEKFVKTANLSSSKVVVEIGCGTGVVTEKLVDSLNSETSFFAVELNSTLADLIKKKFPKINVFNRCAQELPEILSSEGAGKADTIISSLPWASFDLDLQYQILDAIIDSLSDNGEFLTFTYTGANKLPGGKRFLVMLNQKFSKVEKTKIVWANFPPAFIYHCKK